MSFVCKEMDEVEFIAKALEEVPMHTVACPDDCILCIAADLLRELGNR